MARSRRGHGRKLAIGLAAGAATIGAAAAAVATRRRVQRDAPGAAEQRYTCACGAEYRVSGAGRHRVFWSADAPASDPVLEDRCPACGRDWPAEPARAGVPSADGASAAR